MKTTLNKIEAHNPCKEGWETLLKFLGKTKADDEELSLLTILESNGFAHAIWALESVDRFYKEKRLMACDFADEVVHLTNDQRCVNVIKVARDYANGLATKEEMDAANAAANDDDYDAAYVAAYDAAYAATYDAYAANDAAYSVFAATRSAYYAYSAATCSALFAYYAADAAYTDEIKEKQIIIFKKYMK